MSDDDIEARRPRSDALRKKLETRESSPVDDITKARVRKSLERRPLTSDGWLQRWAGIAAALGCSEGAARRYADREHDPLPVSVRLGRVVADPAAVRAWKARQPAPTRAPSTEPIDINVARARAVARRLGIPIPPRKP